MQKMQYGLWFRFDLVVFKMKEVTDPMILFIAVMVGALFGFSVAIFMKVFFSD